MAEKFYNQHRFIKQVEDLLREAGVEPEVKSYADISAGAATMLRGYGLTASLQMEDVIDRPWPPAGEE